MSSRIAQRRLNWVVKMAAEYFAVDEEQILSENREHPVARARQVVIAVLVRRWRMSYPQVGRLVNRDHTTVLHALRRVGADPLVGHLCALADGQDLDGVLPPVADSFLTGYPQNDPQVPVGHFLRRFMDVR